MKYLQNEYSNFNCFRLLYLELKKIVTMIIKNCFYLRAHHVGNL